MKELAAAATRCLDEFESTALEQLESGQELIVQTSSEHIRMVGSIRAAIQCLECHQVRRGTLLGAFTYRLGRSEDDETGNVGTIKLTGQ